MESWRCLLASCRDIKGWLRGMVEEEKEGREGAGDKWKLFVKLIQAIWEQGCIPQQMMWVVIILIPKVMAIIVYRPILLESHRWTTVSH